MFLQDLIFRSACEILIRDSALLSSGFTWIYAPAATGVGGLSCGSTATSTIATFATCNEGDTMVEEALVVTYSLVSPVTTAEATETLTTQSKMSSLIVWAPMIHMYWQSTDREAASTSESTLSTTSETANADNNSSPADISTGAIAGIVIGCVIAVLAIGTAAFFLIRRRRQRKTEPLGNAGSADQATKYHHQQQGQQYQHSSGPSEIDSRTELSELPGTRLIHEMDGDYNRGR